MEKPFSLFLSGPILLLTVAGFFFNTNHLLKLMNIDLNHSVIRVPLIGLLAYGGTKAELRTTRNILFGVGVFYLAMSSAGLVDKKVGGVLPSGLTNFDIVYHFSVGAAALWMGRRSSRMMKP